MNLFKKPLNAKISKKDYLEAIPTYLCRGFLNPYNKFVIKDLADPFNLLESVILLFSGKENEDKTTEKESFRKKNKILYRLEFFQFKNELSLLVQSEKHPNPEEFDTLRPQYFKEEMKVLDIEPFLNDLNEKIPYRFRLRANPTVKITEKESKNKAKKRIPLVKEEDQILWLIKRSKKCGFQVLNVNSNSGNNKDVYNLIPRDDNNFLVNKPRIKYLKPKDKHGNRVTIFSTFYDGILKITDKQKIIEKIKNGIGPAKAFGNGLITLAPLSS
ncbi:MAG: type I-E CRISPR-associated protein Cas6/Cse3/CasE [Candidatus Helarchaeota archaeon]